MVRVSLPSAWTSETQGRAAGVAHSHAQAAPVPMWPGRPGGQGPCRDGGELLKEVMFHGACFSLEGASQPFSDLENSKNVLGCSGCLCPKDSWISGEDVRIRVLFP